MEPSPKRARREKTLIRVCDHFTRTEAGVICPIIKAEQSVRVLYKLQEESLREVIAEAGKTFGLSVLKTELVSPASSTEIEGNLFIEFIGPPLSDYRRLEEMLQEQLTTTLNVKFIEVQNVPDRSLIIPQPIISEYDFEMYRLKLCCEELDQIEKNKNRDEIDRTADNFKLDLEDLRENNKTFALLSQNGKGKSFILNLLMLMSADNQEEYIQNNKDLEIPQGFPDNILWDDLAKSNKTNHQPIVVKDFIKQFEDEDFQMLMPPVCHQLQTVTDTETSRKSLSTIERYFSRAAQLKIEPYFLAQKQVKKGHKSTTKCIIRLRYGTLYEMKVDYFTDVELKQQLFELVTMGNKDSLVHTNENLKKEAQECLEKRYEILTGHTFSDTAKAMLNTPDDIPLLQEVLEFAGKTELYFGQGKDATSDRLALQSVLWGLTTSEKAGENKKRIAAVNQIVVYVPCKIFYGGKEILEMPGTEHLDPIAMASITNALREVDAVMLISENGFTLCEKEVKEMLTESQFLQRIKDDPNNHKLMLFTYPEKCSVWQYGINDGDKIKELEEEGVNRRVDELDMVKKLLKTGSLSAAQETSIFSSNILPVLHSSILAQKEPTVEYELMTKYAGFFKHTGIQNLITHLDEWVLSSQKSRLEEVNTELSQVHTQRNSTMDAEDAKRIVSLCSGNEFKAFHGQQLNEKIDKLKHDQQSEFKQIFENIQSLKTYLSRLQSKATEQWNTTKDQVTSIGVYNPYFKGNNPTYKVRLVKIFFDHLKDEKEYVFSDILSQIDGKLNKYKERTIDLYTKELNTLLCDACSATTTISSEDVKILIENELTSALKWYKGNKQLPFNEKTMETHMNNSQKESLTDIILNPNFRNHSVLEAKENTASNIENCIQNVEACFTGKMKKLHKKRWKKMHTKLWMRNGSSKIWTLLIKSFSKGRYEGALGKLPLMLSAKFN